MDSTRFVIIISIILMLISVSTCLQDESSLQELIGDRESDSLKNGCVCIKNNCGCCERMVLETFDINATVCGNVSYLSNDYGISVTITWNDYVVYNETVSVRNPPPICVGIPELEKLSADVCLQLYDLSFTKKLYHGCAKIAVEIYHVIHKSVNVGCFDIPLHPPKIENFFRWNHVIDREEYKYKEKIPSVIMI
uniref:HisS protein n=1 Tax=Fopius arisanus TaxID=64838 RepID=A0A0C9R8Y3_9HYME